MNITNFTRQYINNGHAVRSFIKKTIRVIPLLPLSVHFKQTYFLNAY